MNSLVDKHILLGITGSIAAYKTPELVRCLQSHGAKVRVVMTQPATEFITPLTLQAISGHAVHTALLDTEAENKMGHIALARWADIVLIAPASANFLAKLTYGLANDLLSTLCLATTSPISVAPAMNSVMWKAEITQQNYQQLQKRGIHIFGPASGDLACGEQDIGRMFEPLEILNCVSDIICQASKLQGKKVLITAGPTREDIDPVRFISNRSSGKMGYAIAQAASLLGAEVTLVSGPTALSAPTNVNFISAYSAQSMLDAVFSNIVNTDIFIATAAVADYRPVQQASNKIKKSQSTLCFELERTQDILATVANLENKPFTVGFAAETHDLEKYALDKLQRKKLDMIAANQVGLEGTGFDSNDNALNIFWPNGRVDLPHCDKKTLAKQLMQVICDRYFNASKVI